MDRWISGGAPRNKLLMGMTATAATFTLANNTVVEVGSPATLGKVGPYIGQAGHTTYYGVSADLNIPGALHTWFKSLVNTR